MSDATDEMVEPWRDDLVSIVVAAWNLESLLELALDSVAKQTHERWEAIVVDDASTDGTWSVIRRFMNVDSRVRGLRNAENMGPAATRNRAISAARGRYLAFLDGDDIWDATKLERQLSMMAETGAAFVFGPYMCMNETGQAIGRLVDGRSPLQVGYRDMLAKRATLGCSTVILDRQQLPQIVMPSLPQGQDYALWLKLLRGGVVAYRLDSVCAHYRIRRNSISRNKLRKARRQWHIYRRQEQLSFTASFAYFTCYAWRAVFRR